MKRDIAPVPGTDDLAAGSGSMESARVASGVVDLVPNSAASFQDDEAEVRIPKLSHVLADRLRQQIANHRLKPGDKLPPEAELVDLFKVSRPTLREALRILEAEGLVLVGRGVRSGATVCAPTAERSAAYAAMVLSMGGTTMEHIHETRMFLEPAVVKSLAHDRHHAVVRTLRGISDAQQAAFVSGEFEMALQAINRFHGEILRSSDNPVLTFLVGMLHSLSGTTSEFLVDGSTGTGNPGFGENMRRTIAGHRRLVDLLEAGDADAAAHYWRTYMERCLGFLSRTGLGQRRLWGGKGGH